MNIAVLGWYGNNNVGDEAFRFAFHDLFMDHSVSFFLPPDIPKGDIIVLGGGAVASPYYLSCLPETPAYAIGIDLAYESEVDLVAARNFKAAYIRTATDAAALKAKVSFPVEHIPDLAFLIRPTGQDVLGKYRKTTKKSLGILVTDYVNPAIDRPVKEFAARAWSFQQNMAEQLDKLSKEFEIFMIPCSTGGYGNDIRINLGIASFMVEGPTQIMATLSPQEMVDLIAGLDVSVCMRFHAHIFSVIAGTPFVSLDFTRKVKLFLHENGLDKSQVCGFHEDEFDASLLKSAVEEAAEENRNKFSSIGRNHHTRLQEFKEQLRRLLFGESS